MNYRELLKQKLDAQAALVNAAINEKRAMTPDEQTQYENFETEIKNLEKTIEITEAQEKRKAQDAKPATEVIYADPKDHSPIYPIWGEFLQDVKKASNPDDRYFSDKLRAYNAASGASEGLLSDGGFLVDKEVINELLKDTYDNAVLAPKCRKWPIGPGKNGLKFNYIDESSRADGSRQGGVLAYWEGEADALVSSKPKFGQLDMSLKKLTGLYYATDELVEDAIALEAAVREFFSEEFAFKMDDAIIRGTGAGQPLGILSSPALITVSKTSSQTADTVTFNNVLDMWTRMRARNRSNAIWLINQEVEPQLQKMTIATGTYSGATVYMPPTGINGVSYSTLFGRPVLPIEQAAALGDKGDIILMDPREYLLIDKGGINFASSIHVRFLYDENVYRFIYRIDGQPRRKSAITPYKGASTLSPYVTLEARA